MVIHKTRNATKFLGLPLARPADFSFGPSPQGKAWHSPSSAAGPAPPGWRSWWPWSCSAPPLCCTAWQSGSRSLPSAQPAPSPIETALQQGWDTGPGQGPLRSPPLSTKHSHSEFPGRNGRGRKQASPGWVSPEGWVPQSLHCRK